MKKFLKPTKKIPTIRKKKGVKTLQELIERSLLDYSNKTAYIKIVNGHIQSFTYEEVFESVTKLASYLKNQGIKKGDNIAIIGENSPEWAISYFASTWAGATTVPLDSKAPLETNAFLADFSSVKALFFSKKCKTLLDLLKSSSATSLVQICMDDISDIVKKTKKGIDKEKVEEDDLCEILFTSGTTGAPKGVMLTHRNLTSNVEDIYSSIDIGTEDTAFSILPIHHAYERTVGMLTPFHSGAKVFYATSLKPSVMLNELKLARPSIWLNTPLVLEKLYKRINSEIQRKSGPYQYIMKCIPKKLLGHRIKASLGLQNIRYIVSGGAALPDYVRSGLESLGFPLLQGYGLSEAAPLVSANPPSKPRNQSVGLVIQSVEAEIREPDAEGNGEIFVKGSNVMKGYYKNPEATKEAITQDGWLKTGDIGYFDSDGYLYITGRKKHLIITRGGKNIYPEEIEEKILQLPNVKEVMVFSPDGEVINALIHPDIDSFNVNKNELDNHTLQIIHETIEKEIRSLNKKLEPHKRIRRIVIKKEEFPKTTTNKIKRYLFKENDLKNKNFV